MFTCWKNVSVKSEADIDSLAVSQAFSAEALWAISY